MPEQLITCFFFSFFVSLHFDLKLNTFIVWETARSVSQSMHSVHVCQKWASSLHDHMHHIHLTLTPFPPSWSKYKKWKTVLTNTTRPTLFTANPNNVFKKMAKREMSVKNIKNNKLKCSPTYLPCFLFLFFFCFCFLLSYTQVFGCFLNIFIWSHFCVCVCMESKSLSYMYSILSVLDFF